tara:strand:- start:148 stop:669 length:522 start_codon:yes stop_codon:yes gene_type:complete
MGSVYSKEMTPDQCFNEMGKLLGFEDPESTGYVAILDKVKELKEENKKLNKNMSRIMLLVLRCGVDDCSIDEVCDRISKMKGEVHKWGELCEDFGVDSRVDIFNLINKLKEERDRYFKHLADKDLECEEQREHAFAAEVDRLDAENTIIKMTEEMDKLVKKVDELIKESKARY